MTRLRSNRQRASAAWSVVSVVLGAATSLAACGMGASSTNSSTAGSSAGGASASSTASTSTLTSTTSASSGTGACATCARDWTQYPPIAEVDNVSELWALSDVHGDYTTIASLLAGAHVITAVPTSPQTVEWSAGSAALVVVGDLIDKGPDAPDVVRLFIALKAGAEAAGGHVIVTMGNHEAEFLADPNNSKATDTEGFDPELTAIGLSPTETAAGMNDLGSFIRDLPVAARVGDWFFAHAGKTDGKSLSELSMDLEMDVDANGFGGVVLSAPDSLVEARLNNTGPQWWDVTNDPQALLTLWAQELGAQHLVMGHEPGKVLFADGSTRNSDEMLEKYNGAIFLIDTGMSVAVDDTGGALLHVTGVGGASEGWKKVLPDGSSHSL